MSVAEELQRERAETRRRFRSPMDNCVDAILITDQNGIILNFNPAAEAIFQYRPAEVIGLNVSILMPESNRSANDGYLWNYLATGVAKIIGIGREVCGCRKDETTFPIELSVGAR